MPSNPPTNSIRKARWLWTSKLFSALASVRRPTSGSRISRKPTNNDKFVGWAEENLSEGVQCFCLFRSSTEAPAGIQRLRECQRLDQGTHPSCLLGEKSLLRLVTGVLIEIPKTWETGKDWLFKSEQKEIWAAQSATFIEKSSRGYFLGNKCLFDGDFLQFHCPI